MLTLQRHRDRLTDAPVRLIAISRSGATTGHADATFTADDLIEAWRG
jgi:hypothetical protein